MARTAVPRGERRWATLPPHLPAPRLALPVLPHSPFNGKTLSQAVRIELANIYRPPSSPLHKRSMPFAFITTDLHIFFWSLS